MNKYELGDVIEVPVGLGEPIQALVTETGYCVPLESNLHPQRSRGVEVSLLYNTKLIAHIPASKIDLSRPVNDKWLKDMREALAEELNDVISYGDLEEFDIELKTQEQYDFSTEKQPYNNEVVEEKSRVPAENYVDFSNIDILTGAPKK